MEHTKADKNKLAEVIDVKEVGALRAWADKFDVTTAKLKAAVNAVGNSSKDVEIYLQKSSRK